LSLEPVVLNTFVFAFGEYDFPLKILSVNSGLIAKIDHPFFFLSPILKLFGKVVLVNFSALVSTLW
jgi:hypothetical protein